MSSLPPHDIYLLDSYEGHIEAFELETWLENTNFPVWEEAIHHISYDYNSVHEWRLKRIEWCMNKLSKGIYK